MPNAKYDLNKIISEYPEDDDFGFTTVDEAKYEAVIAEKDETVEEYRQEIEEYKKRLLQVEKVILPFLKKLLKTHDQPYIHWPNRKPALESQIQKVLELTRG